VCVCECARARVRVHVWIPGKFLRLSGILYVWIRRIREFNMTLVIEVLLENAGRAVEFLVARYDEGPHSIRI
jgi:hypothetical protein